MTHEAYDRYCKNLQGRVKFPTGGNVRLVREPCIRLIRCDSETDSKVWMKEDAFFVHVPELFRAFFVYGISSIHGDIDSEGSVCGLHTK